MSEQLRNRETHWADLIAFVAAVAIGAELLSDS